MGDLKYISPDQVNDKSTIITVRSFISLRQITLRFNEIGLCYFKHFLQSPNDNSPVDTEEEAEIKFGIPRKSKRKKCVIFDHEDNCYSIERNAVVSMRIHWPKMFRSNKLEVLVSCRADPKRPGKCAIEL